MITLVGREWHVAELKSALDSDKSEFVAFTGRRRVGKTYLIGQVFKDNIDFELTGIHKAKRVYEKMQQLCCDFNQ